MSFGFRPQSAIAFSAASACNWICDMSGMTPSFVVSAAPTTATVLCGIASAFRRTEEGERDRVGLFGEHHFERHVELQRLGRLRAFDNVRHHARTFRKLHHGDRIGRLEAGDLAMMDHVAIEDRAAAGGECVDLPRCAFRAERAWREIRVPAFVAALQAKLAGFRAVPEMLCLRRRLWKGAAWLWHWRFLGSVGL